jgi:hypothetical protein
VTGADAVAVGSAGDSAVSAVGVATGIVLSDGTFDAASERIGAADTASEFVAVGGVGARSDNGGVAVAAGCRASGALGAGVCVPAVRVAASGAGGVSLGRSRRSLNGGTSGVGDGAWSD